MRIPNGYDTVAAYDGNVERVPAGGHICKIKSARVDTLANGSEQLVLALDISEGSELDGVYKRIFDSKHTTNTKAKWPCVFSQFLLDRDGYCSPYFKGLIKCIVESNAGYCWAWDETTLKGKMIGFIFREEEFEAQDGNIKTIVRPAFARTVQRIRDGVPVPEIKRLRQSNGSPLYGGTAAQTSMAQSGFTQVDDDEMPF